LHKKTESKERDCTSINEKRHGELKKRVSPKGLREKSREKTEKRV